MLLALNKKRLSKIALFLAFVYMTCFLTGCFFLGDRTKPTKSNCIVNSVGGMNGGNRYICRNDTDTYVYSKGAFYRYISDGKLEFITYAEDYLRYMACSNKYIYYNICCNTINKLYRINIENQETECIYDGNTMISGIANHGSDVFVKINKLAGLAFAGYATVYCYSDNSEENYKIVNTCLEAGKNTKESKCSIKGQFADYTIFGHYNKDYEIKNYEVDMIVASDDWYTCFDTEAISYIRSNDEAVVFDDSEYIFRGGKYDIEAMYTGDKDGSFVSSGHTCTIDKDIYMLVQYGRGNYWLFDNPPSVGVKCNAIIKLSPIDNKSEVIYKTENRSSQIANFSIENDAIYLYKNDRIYRHSISNGKEEELTVLPEARDLYFEWCNDRLFIFYGEDLEDCKFFCTVK